MDLVPSRPPAELELEEARTELERLETELAERELELLTLRTELRRLEISYRRTVGRRYAELDELEAEIAELQARSRPADPEAQRRATEARSRAEDTTRAASEAEADPETAERFTPPPELKNLYRQVAKKIHPDLAESDADRERRTELMAEANLAYAAGDAETLGRILDEWEAAAEVAGEGPEGELIWMQQKIARVHKRLTEIARELGELRASDLYTLLRQVEVGRREGRNLLQELSAQVESQIEDARARLDALRAS